jgi:acyl phosphate:glycerol-3-phosphate acyltransferase
MQNLQLLYGGCDHVFMLDIDGGFAVLAAYLAGSLSFAVIVSRLMGLYDPRSYGSGNPGATNVLRSGNKLAAILTLLLDALKGWVPVVMVQTLGWADSVQAWVGMAAFIGHLWPVFFKFKGGKGVATAAGVLLAFNPWMGLATCVVWASVAGTFRYSSLAALAAALFAPIFQWWMWGAGPILAATIFMSVLLLWRHRSNIEKLLNGTESKLGRKPTTIPSTTSKGVEP